MLMEILGPRVHRYVTWILCIILVILLLSKIKVLQEFLRFHYNKLRSTRLIHGPKALPFFGNSLLLLKNPEHVFKTLRQWAKDHRSFYKAWGFYLTSINLYDPIDIEKILSSPTLITKSDSYEWVSPWLQQGLLLSSGEKWKTRRRLLNPAFHINILNESISVFDEHSDQMVRVLEPECEKSHTDILPFITNFAIEALCETTMGWKGLSGNVLLTKYKEGIERYSEILLYRLARIWMYVDVFFYWSPVGRELLKLSDFLKKFTTDVINERIRTWDDTKSMGIETASGKRRLAMLDLLIYEMKNTSKIDYNGIREEVDTFMFEGHETTSVGLAYLMLLLANNPDVQDRIVAEMRSVMGNTRRAPKIEDLQAMSYLEMCIKETLRLYPPVSFMARQTTEAFKLREYTIQPGVFIHLQVYDLHHNPDVWPDPERFDPERFLPENIAARHPYAYIPFSAGLRNCIGQRFAMYEIKVCILKILMEYILEPVDSPESLVLVMGLVIRPRDGIKLKLRKRQI